MVGLAAWEALRQEASPDPGSLVVLRGSRYAGLASSLPQGKPFFKRLNKFIVLVIYHRMILIGGESLCIEFAKKN